MALIGAFLEFLERPTIGGVLVDMLLFLVPVWIAFVVGVIVGWAWKPRWAATQGYNGKFNCSAVPSPSVDVISSPVKGLGSTQSLNSFGSGAMEDGVDKEQVYTPIIEEIDCGSSQLKKEEGVVVTQEDLEHLCHLVDRTDGGPPWKHVMDRSTPNMSYQAWQRDPETGPPQYCSRTVYEDATPELLRDFFWDDAFRLKWDDMLLYSATIEECPTTGTMVVHWVRKFPFFCSDREYIIGRRIWESGRSYYCITKGVPCTSVPRSDKPRRVDLYYSSWCIQAVASSKGNGQLTACEVILFHHEDMGIPWEIAKFGVRQGMWGTVKKIERGLRAYQKERASGAPLSRSAFLAQVNTKINPDYLKSLESAEDSPETEIVGLPEKPMGMNVPKLLFFSGAVVLACSLDRGLLTKAVIFGVARRFGNLGRRL
ncbi:StAR-related lipid transfer protein like [Actinidia chinensis var. chinensis]|uniref:StAR-related lipid transfer protein like n=1 Tax=Actinidia chinensis var. chinensis TaxID=1590841 RepID=A0A2R6RSE4_ACTCC|nr:StAR-related lipid transfer protein like [Actinidia chinensis var. chinensis]